MTTQADADNFAESETVKLLRAEVERLNDKCADLTQKMFHVRKWVEDLQAGRTCCTKCGWCYSTPQRPVTGAYLACPPRPHSADETDGTQRLGG